MSGQPLIHPTDASKFREQYLAELAQQIANDDRNLQANKIYKKTGQTPSIVLDTRTSGEKLADIQRLKIEIRSGLNEIMDGATAEKVVQETGIDGIEFLAQRLPEIVSILKPKYKYGVPFVNFMTFMREYAQATIDNGDYLAGNQAKVGQQVLMGVRQILGEMVNKETLRKIAIRLETSMTVTNVQIANAIRRDISELSNVIPSKEELARMLSEGGTLLTREIQKQLNDALQELPTVNQVQELLLALDTATNMRDAKRQEELLLKLHQLLAMKPEVLQQIQLIRNEIGETGRQIGDLKAFVEKEIKDSSELAQGRLRISVGQLTDLITRQLREQIMLRELSDEEMRIFIEEKLAEQTKDIKSDTEKRRGEEAELRRLSERLSPDQKARLLGLTKTPTELTTPERKRTYIDDILNGEFGQLIMKGQSKGQFLTESMGAKQTTNTGEAKLNKGIDEINTRIGILTGSPVSKVAEEPAKKGSGLRKGRGIRGGSVSDLTGILAYPKVVPFGRYFINTKRLGDDIITIKRPSGQGLTEYPSRKVSRDLGNVMRVIVGGGQPEYEDMEKLSDEEKIYLKNIVKKSDIQDRLKLIAPNKSDDEKDIHSFEVMKGEILAGNDNVDLVKKFKILILKMMRKDMLPKNQAKDLLLDLATLGY